jgi:hypothetical protein
MLTPRYIVGCKRLVLDPGWYDTLKDPKFSLHTSRLKRFEDNCLVLDTGSKETKVATDVLLLATGYSPTSNFLSSISITGRDGIDLQNIWNARGGPQAYLGLAMDQFPNLYFVSGPNSSVSHGSVMAGIENSVCYIMQLMMPVLEGQIESLEVKKDACCTWTQKVQLASKVSIWVKGGCSNWYIDERRWNSMIYPYVLSHPLMKRLNSDSATDFHRSISTLPAYPRPGMTGQLLTHRLALLAHNNESGDIASGSNF